MHIMCWEEACYEIHDYEYIKILQIKTSTLSHFLWV